VVHSSVNLEIRGEGELQRSVSSLWLFREVALQQKLGYLISMVKLFHLGMTHLTGLSRDVYSSTLDSGFQKRSLALELVNHTPLNQGRRSLGSKSSRVPTT
jgi:hypothetical protein